MTRPVRLTLCPGTQARGDNISAGMGAGTSCIYAYETLCCHIYCCPDVVDDCVLAIEGTEHGRYGG